MLSLLNYTSTEKPKPKELLRQGGSITTASVGEVVSVQDGYMGEDWVELLSDDLKRYVADEKMTLLSNTSGNSTGNTTSTGSGNTTSNTTSSGMKMCWIDRDGSNSESISNDVAYPAITELLDNLHTFPYEINSK